MSHVLMEGFGEIYSPSIVFGKGHFYVVEVACGPRDNQMHRAEFHNEALEFLLRQSVLARGDCQEIMEVCNTFWR